MRPLFTTAIVISLAGDLLALAPAFPLLLVCRIIMAVSGASCCRSTRPSSPSSIRPRRRGLPSAWQMASLACSTCTAISGWIVDRWSWRVLFGVLAPATILILILGLAFLTNITKTSRTHLDRLSAVLSSAGLGLLLYGFGQIGAQGGMTWLTDLFLLIGLALVAWFCVRQNRISNPMLRLRCFRSPSFRLAALLALIEDVSLLAPELVLPMYNQ